MAQVHPFLRHPSRLSCGTCAEKRPPLSCLTGMDDAPPTGPPPPVEDVSLVRCLRPWPPWAAGVRRARQWSAPREWHMPACCRARTRVGRDSPERPFLMPLHAQGAAKAEAKAEQEDALQTRIEELVLLSGGVLEVATLAAKAEVEARALPRISTWRLRAAGYAAHSACTGPPARATGRQAAHQSKKHDARHA